MIIIKNTIVNSSIKVLFVDDEVNILNAFQRLFRHEKFEMDVSSSPIDALKMLEREEYAVVVTDQNMPGMEGTEFLQQVRCMLPDSIRILLTGQANTRIAIASINQGAVYRFLQKPWSDDEFQFTIRQAVQQYTLTKLNQKLLTEIQHINKELIIINQSLDQKITERTAVISNLHLELKESFIAVIQVMAKLAEKHSPLLGGHAQRVARRCYKIGKILQLSEEDLTRLVISATLHDLGKISIAAEILKKPEHLLQESELEQLQNHPVQGATLLQLVPNLQTESNIILHHHEYFDGSGYPDGLKGEAIPIESRIIAVVDTIDKLIHRTKQRNNFSLLQAVEILQRKQNEKFDPNLLDLLKIHHESLSAEEASVREIPPSSLISGMILAKPITTQSGLILLEKDEILKEDQLPLLQRVLEYEALPSLVCIYNNLPD